MSRGGAREGAGRKKKEIKAITVSFCLTPEQKEKLEQKVIKSRLSRSSYIIKMLKLD